MTPILLGGSMRALAPVLALALLVVAPIAAADHPGSNKGLQGILDGLTIPGVAAPLETNLVHRLPTVDAKFAAWESTYPDLVERATIGQTSSGQPLLNVRITDEKADPPLSTGKKLVVYLDGGHHGNEYLGVELVMYYLEDLLVEASSGDADVLRFLAETELYATPIINVDGNFADSRKNSNLVDPNRNYDFMWGGDEGSSGVIIDGTYRGPEPFSEDETRANAEFQQQIRPDIVVTMHTGIAEFYWPWGWTHDPSPDDEMFVSLEKPFEEITNGRVDAMQGAELYIVTGASDDWAYGVLGAPGFTFEVHEDQNLPVYGQPIPEIIADQLAGLDWIVKNVRHIGAWVELAPAADGSGWVATNEGWGDAANVTVTTGSGSVVIPRIERGETVPLDIEVDGSTTWSYPVLFINSTKTREHSLATLDAASVPAAAQIPGPTVALGVLALAAVAVALRRR